MILLSSIVEFNKGEQAGAKNPFFIFSKHILIVQKIKTLNTKIPLKYIYHDNLNLIFKKDKKFRREAVLEKLC